MLFLSATRSVMYTATFEATSGGTRRVKNMNELLLAKNSPKKLHSLCTVARFIIAVLHNGKTNMQRGLFAVQYGSTNDDRNTLQH